MFNKFVLVPQETKYVIVSDLFKEDYVGGAELTLEAILSACPDKYYKIHSANVTPELITKNKDKIWIIGNFANLAKEASITIATDTKYYVIECDFKMCMYRSQQLHKIQTKQECNCHLTEHGRFVLGFFKRAQKVFFMSAGQMNIYKNLFPTMNNWSKDKLLVQGSTFDQKTLDQIKTLNAKYLVKNNKWFIQGGGQTSWIKNTQGCIQYCIDNKLEYDIVGGLNPTEFLDKLAQYTGLIFFPAGADTSPRITIEAKLLNLDLQMNNFVLQKEDDWFNLSAEALFSYLEDLPNKFWNTL